MHFKPPRLTVELPDFRKASTLLRALVLVVLLRGVWLASLPADAPLAWQDGFFELATLATTAALVALAWLGHHLHLRTQWLLNLLAVVFTPVLLQSAWLAVLPLSHPSSGWQTALVSGGIAAVVLLYFQWRHLRLSPALAETRLMALQSRIQPHFLFNSLNSALALVRTDPTKAESVLQDMADLFRAVLSDSRKLVPLADELRLARAYIDIETTRLGPDRLQLQWLVQHAPLQARVPPLLLQPLLENAVRHAVEPAPQGAQITVEIYQDGSHMRLFVRNPVFATTAGTAGHQIALDNLRERLALHFDHEAALKVQVQNNEFVVQVVLPLQ